ncbi:hypothetical protein B6U81_01705 [Thermoplasmatales archaeon ex4484_30]|nr:MAG: hypothetical protein B6U81_01705 [Thermoplasmatales archaeon ex4484_30]
MGIEVLEKEKALQILIEIYKIELNKEDKLNRAKNKISIKVGGSPSTFIKRFNELEKAGLIRIEQQKEFPFKEFVYLTPKGKEIAKHLIEIEKIMEEG